MAYSKYQSFFEEMNSKDTGLLESLEQGAIPLLHVDNYNFRDINKAAHREKKGGIYIQNYEPAERRASYSQKTFRSGHLKEDQFNANLPHKNHAHWLKVRKLSLEGPSMRFGSKTRTENERIANHLSTGDGYWTDHAKKDTSMIFYPDWKPNQPNKWINKRGIDNTTVLQAKPKSRPPWEEFPVRENGKPEEYIDSLEKVGEKILRVREKSKEKGRPEFISMVGEDILGKSQHVSQSLRTMKAQRVMGIHPDVQEYSKQHARIPFYKQSLIETKSVDHQVPYLHSQNARGRQLKDIMPVTEKIYNLSLQQMKGGRVSPRGDSRNVQKTSDSIEDYRPKSHQGSPERIRLTSASVENTNKHGREIKDPNVTSIILEVPPEPAATEVTQCAKPLTTNDSMNRRRISSKHSAGPGEASLGTTNNSWNQSYSRAQTALENGNGITNGTRNRTLSSHMRRRLAAVTQQEPSLQEKFNSDQYYQPSDYEAKCLISKYFQ